MFRQNVKKLKATTLFLCLMAYFLQYVIQTTGIIHHDILWSFEIGKRLLDGKRYGEGFFETNPPLLYYFYALIIYTSQKTSIPPIKVFTSLITLISIISLYLQHQFINRIFNQQLKIKIILLVATIVLQTFVLNIDYGQKEMIMVLLCFPFFWLSLIRIKDEAISNKTRIAISFMAALGFAFKPPYFYCAWIANEIFILSSSKKISDLFSIENIIIGLFFIVYLAITATFSKSYLTEIFPFIQGSYANSSFISSIDIYFCLPIITFFITAVFSLVFIKLIKQGTTEELDTIKLWGLISFSLLISFVIQQKGWRYQALPLYAANAILMVIVGFVINQQMQKDKVFKLLSMLCLFILLFTAYIAPTSNEIINKMRCAWLKDCRLNDNINEISKHSIDKQFFIFSTHMEAGYLIYYGKLKLSSRFASLWPLPGIMNAPSEEKDKLNTKLKDKIYFDLNKEKPGLIVISTKNKDYINDDSFNFIDYINQDKRLRLIWLEYQFIGRFELAPGKGNHFDLYGKI